MTAAAQVATDAPREEMIAAHRRTMKWIAIGWTSFVIAFPSAWYLLPRLAPIDAPTDRLLVALQLAAAPAALLLLVVSGLMRAQDTLEAEADPLAGKESRGFKINQRVLTNSIEQALIFLPLFVALAIRMQPEQAYWLPLLMGSWCVARLMFWIGYRLGNHFRAPGMDWTLGTTFVTGVLLVLTLF
jgi:hypothetical protein